MLIALSRRPEFRKLLNTGMLVGGYGAGQGSLFLAQTWLVARNDLGLLAFFGTHFAFAVLGILIVEAGSIVGLARFTVISETEKLPTGWIWERYWETSVFRLCIAATLSSGVLAYLFLFAPDETTSRFAIFFLPALLLWSFNCAGLIDGLNLSGVSGITASFPFFFASVALWACNVFTVTDKGAVLAAAVSLGYAMSVASHFGLLIFLGYSPRFSMPSRQGLLRAFRDGTALLLTQTPGQFYFRFQLLVCSTVLGEASTAIFVYVKQIVVGFIQITGFLRRAEFPGLIKSMNDGATCGPLAVLKNQRMGTYAAIAANVLLIAATPIIGRFGGEVFHTVAANLVVFSIIISFSAIDFALAQGLMALGQYGLVSRNLIVSTLLGAAVSYLFAPVFGLYAFALADLLQHTLNIALAQNNLRKGAGH